MASYKKDLKLSASDYKRQVAREPYIALKNRYAENNPVLSDTPVSLIARPGLRRWQVVGEGPIRKLFSEPGTFNDDLFVVSGIALYRVDKDFGTPTFIGNLGSNPTGRVDMAATGVAGDYGANLWIAEGGVLWLYKENGNAIGHLEASGDIADTYQIEIGGVYYTWTAGSVDTGTPAGTSGAPWLVKLGASNAESMTNMYNAINASGTPGTDYSTGLTEHPTVSATAAAGSDLYVIFDEPGVDGNSVTTTSTGANIAWVEATLQDGGEPGLRQVDTPDDNGAISVATINSYVIVVCIQDEELGTTGRFYWINPGEEEIDPLNFATAERSPDKIHQVKVFGEMFWLLGEKTTEPWITTGQALTPMQRFQGILFDRGSWEGTAIQIKESLLVIDEDGAVFQIGGGLKRISRPDVEEKIRKSIQIQKSLGA